MSSPAIAHAYHMEDDSPLIIERLLRNRSSVWQQIKQEYRLNELIQQMLTSSAVTLAVYGAVMGFSHSFLQAGSSAIKLPILFLVTLAICLPTLYLFNLLYGGWLSVRQTLALALAAITVTSALTLSFAPITLFFLLTAQSYHFYVLLNVVVLTLSGIAGLSFLVSGMRHMNLLHRQEQQTVVHTVESMSVSEQVVSDQQEYSAESESATQPVLVQPASQPAPSRVAQPVNMTFLYIWLMVYGFVGTQLGWTLRPFFGNPGGTFELFRSVEGNFYMAIVQIMLELLYIL